MECPTLENTSPYIIINPVGIHNIGDVVEINGTTNLNVDSKVQIEIAEPQQPEVAPYPPSYSNNSIPVYQLFDHRGYVTIQNGTCGTNFWSYRVALPKNHSPWYRQYLVDVRLYSDHSIENDSAIKIITDN